MFSIFAVNTSRAMNSRGRVAKFLLQVGVASGGPTLKLIHMAKSYCICIRSGTVFVVAVNIDLNYSFILWSSFFYSRN